MASDNDKKDGQDEYTLADLGKMMDKMCSRMDTYEEDMKHMKDAKGKDEKEDDKKSEDMEQKKEDKGQRFGCR